MAIDRLYRRWPALCVTAILAGCAVGGTGAPLRRTDLLGTPVAEQAGQRIVTITPETVAVNVTGGETVRFIAGARSFAWSFQVSTTVTMFGLNQIAPAGMLTHPVAVYVAPDPLYISNS